MTRLIEVRGLHFQYDDGSIALECIDFDLHVGETVALLGPNGSGKTTFALHLNCLLPGGEHVRVCGMAATSENAAAIRRKVGVVFQDSEAQLFLPTVLEDAMFAPLNAGRSRAEARALAMRALEATGVAYAVDKAPYHLSAGEKRRVAIAGVLAMEPDVLVLDEPTTFLDPPGQRDLANLLRSLRQAKVIITHDAGFAGKLANRGVFFERGRVVADGPLEEVIRRFDWRA
jgi:energy-coupling factor transporter ATP-binding protein EcfA2